MGKPQSGRERVEVGRFGEGGRVGMQGREGFVAAGGGHIIDNTGNGVGGEMCGSLAY